MAIAYDRNGITVEVGDARGIVATETDGSWDAVITDPPYGINRAFGRSELGHRRCAGDENTNLASWLWPEAFRVLKEPGWALVFCGWSTVGTQMEHAMAAGFTIKTVIVWDKTLPGLGAGIRGQHELIVAARRGMPKEWYTGGNVWRVRREKGRPPHPNQKPVELMAQLITRFTEPGAAILDPFAGVGSTLVAALETGRRAKGIEIDPHYAAVAVARVYQDPPDQPS